MQMPGMMEYCHLFVSDCMPLIEAYNRCDKMINSSHQPIYDLIEIVL